ncbi:Crp/Fnr family transcriptional regulator [Candidatus Bipolaricaulota bacterium]
MSTSTRPTFETVRDIEHVFARCEPLRIRYAPDELICQSGCYAAGVYLLTSGIVLESYVDRTSRAGDVATGLLGVGDLIGTELLLAGQARLHQTSCRALSDVSLTFLERSAFEAAVEAHDPLRRFLAAHLAERGLRLTRTLWRSQLAPEERLCALLLDLVLFAESADGMITLPRELDHRLLATLAHLPLRRARQACRLLPGVEWREDRLAFSLDVLDDWRSTAEPSP